MKRLLCAIAAICLFATMLTACSTADAERFTVEYRSGYDSAPAVTEQHQKGETFKLREGDVFERSGYEFVGWSDGENTFDAGADYTMPSDKVTFTAVWNDVSASSVDGDWSGAEIDGNLFDIDDTTLSATASVKREDGGIYAVLSIGDKDASVDMKAAIFVKGEGNAFSYDDYSINFSDGKMTLTADFGSGSPVTLTFDERKDLEESPSVSGTYVAIAGEETYTIDFDASTYNVEQSDESGRGETDVDDGTGSSSDRNDGQDGQEETDGDRTETMPKGETGTPIGGDRTEIMPRGETGSSAYRNDVQNGINGDRTEIMPRSETGTRIGGAGVYKFVKVGRYIVLFENEIANVGDTNSGDDINVPKEGKGNSDDDMSAPKEGNGNSVDEMPYGATENGPSDGSSQDEGDMSGGMSGGTDGGMSGGTDGGMNGESGDMSGSEEDTADLRSVLVLYEGESGTLIGCTAEGERLEFTQSQDAND